MKIVVQSIAKLFKNVTKSDIKNFSRKDWTKIHWTHLLVIQNPSKKKKKSYLHLIHFFFPTAAGLYTMAFPNFKLTHLGEQSKLQCTMR